MASEAISNRQIRLRDFRYPGEVWSLLLTFLILTTLYALALHFFPSTWKQFWQTLVITLLGLAVYIITVVVQQRAAFGTLVRVSPRQFAEIYEAASRAAEHLSSSFVPVYVKRSSEQNIYTLGLWGQPLIVITSAMIDQMSSESLQFFIGREIGHIKAGHTWLRTLLRPLGAGVPVIGKLLDSVIFGDWMNRTEMTADRAGFIACNSLTVAVSTMLKFSVGVKLFEKLDIREFLEQINNIRSLGGRVTEIVAEQPYLIERVRRLVRFALSKEFRGSVSDEARYTRILEALPHSFVNNSLYELTPAGQRAAGKAEPSGTGRTQNENPPTLIESTTRSDSIAEDENNDFDQRLVLSAASGESHLLRRQRTRIGRNLDNDIVLVNDRVSRYHAEIVRQGKELRLADAGSRNGVWLNGQKLAAPAALKPGDVVRIGREELTFRIRG